MSTSWLTVPRNFMESLGEIFRFCTMVIGHVFSGRVFKYFGEALNQAGILVLGSTTVIFGLVFVIGLTCGIEGAYFNRSVGAPAYAGVFAAWCDLREAIPYAFGYMLSAKVGTGIVAELGAMRISDEIDALEVMGIKSISYLVSTRLVAASVVIIPLYAMSLIMAFLAAQLTTTVLYGQSGGTYNHYFHTFLRPDDVFWSFVEVIIISVFVMINHCYFGYNASGGPVGVGEAVGKSMRASLVLIQFVVLFASLALYGTNPNFNLTV